MKNVIMDFQLLDADNGYMKVKRINRRRQRRPATVPS
jgi:hypothetical protein